MAEEKNNTELQDVETPEQIRNVIQSKLENIRSLRSRVTGIEREVSDIMNSYVLGKYGGDESKVPGQVRFNTDTGNIALVIQNEEEEEKEPTKKRSTRKRAAKK